jgi:cell division septation protein DedD
MPAPVLASPGGEAKEERYLLQVATLANQKQALALQQRLRASHLKAVIINRKTGGKTLYQVQVGPVTGAKAAADAASHIKSQEKISVKVVKLAPRTGGPNHVRRPSR